MNQFLTCQQGCLYSQVTRPPECTHMSDCINTAQNRTKLLTRSPKVTPYYVISPVFLDIHAMSLRSGPILPQWVVHDQATATDFSMSCALPSSFPLPPLQGSSPLDHNSLTNLPAAPPIHGLAWYSPVSEIPLPSTHLHPQLLNRSSHSGHAFTAPCMYPV